MSNIIDCYNKSGYPIPQDKFDESSKQFDYWDMIGFAEMYASNWISIEDRLPEIGQKVITFRPLAELSGDEKITIQSYVGGKNTSPQGIVHGFDRWCHPTHWMPLLEPPI